MRRAGYEETAKYIGISPVSLRSLVSRKKIPHTRISDRVVVFDLDELDPWLAAKHVPVGGTP